MSVVQLGTVTTVLGSANKDIVLYGNFLWIFKNTFFKEALKSYLEREVAKIQLLCADWRKCAGEVRALHRLFPTPGTSFFLSSGAGWPLLPLCPSLEFLWNTISLTRGDCHEPVGFSSGLKIASTLPSSPFPTAALAASLELQHQFKHLGHHWRRRCCSLSLVGSWQPQRCFAFKIQNNPWLFIKKYIWCHFLNMLCVCVASVCTVPSASRVFVVRKTANMFGFFPLSVR